MLAPEDLPGQHARVMRVAGSSTAATGPSALAPPVAQSEGKVEKFSEDYASSSSSSSSGSEEDEADNTSARVPKAAGRKKQDDGWGVVSSKKKSESPSHPNDVLISRTRLDLILFLQSPSLNFPRLTDGHQSAAQKSEKSRNQESYQSSRGGRTITETGNAQASTRKVGLIPYFQTDHYGLT